MAVAFALTFALGYERELRGSPAGDRTFSLIGTASAVLGNLAGAGSPNAIAGAVTGIGLAARPGRSCSPAGLMVWQPGRRPRRSAPADECGENP